MLQYSIAAFKSYIEVPKLRMPVIETWTIVKKLKVVFGFK